MTEEEMMDLALRLSEQEASKAAHRRRQEEEAMMKAIEESMVSQTQPCPASQSGRLLSDAEPSCSLPSRRKLFYPNGKGPPAGDQGAGDQGAGDQGAGDQGAGDQGAGAAAGCTWEANLSQDPKGAGDENNNRRKKRKRKEGSPLLEMPDLSQTQKIYSQASPFSSQSSSVPLDSLQGNGIDHDQDDEFDKITMPSKSGHEEESNKISKDRNSARTELTSDITLRWSDEDEETVK
uniref:uncharacterized protein n=1 Tax=Centroberyx gerrardi TaxID=166262 RepID=UPI003AAB0DCF